MLPNMANAIMAWQQTITVEVITKTLVNYQVTETKTPVSFLGVLINLQSTQLELKPEGQRQWNWVEVHSLTDLEVKLDDEVVIKNRRFRVMASADYSDYGYYRYELAEAFTS